MYTQSLKKQTEKKRETNCVRKEICKIFEWIYLNSNILFLGNLLFLYCISLMWSHCIVSPYRIASHTEKVICILKMQSDLFKFIIEKCQQKPNNFLKWKMCTSTPFLLNWAHNFHFVRHTHTHISMESDENFRLGQSQAANFTVETMRNNENFLIPLISLNFFFNFFFQGIRPNQKQSNLLFHFA